MLFQKNRTQPERSDIWCNESKSINKLPLAGVITATLKSHFSILIKEIQPERKDVRLHEQK